MKLNYLIKICLPFIVCSAARAQQAPKVVLNGDFDNIDSKTKLPVAWDNYMGDKTYTYKVDSTVVKHGKYSMSITAPNDANNFGAISCLIPYSFKGHRLQMKGYIKTENVDGYAGIWVRVDGTPAFNNMQDQKIHGTTDWKEYTFELPYMDGSAININVGALLAGKGKMWVDDVRLYLDGTPIEKVKLIDNSQLGAVKDTAFSKSSGINTINTDVQTVNNLALLAQVWGFVKYHLPAVAAGNINMDAELFRVMPSVINAKNNKEACGEIEKWIDKLGKPVLCKSCKPFDKKDAIEIPDYGVLFNTHNVTKTLAEKLTYILNNRNTGSNYYIKMSDDGVGNPVFQHELLYSKVLYPDAGVRLLTLFRYWNMIQYFYPYKHLIGADWKKVLYDFIPEFINDKNDSEYDMTTLKLISSIHDTHANIWASLKGITAYKGEFAPPVQAKFIEDKLVVTNFFSDTAKCKTTLKLGDVITAIDGTPVEALIKKYLPVTAASNYETQLRDMPQNYLLRSKDSIFKFTIDHDGKQEEVEQKAVKYTKLNYASLLTSKAPAYYVMNGNIGYLYPGKYHNKDLDDIKKMFEDAKGIIVDMRCYPSEFMPFTFVPYIKSGSAPFVKFGRGDVSNPGLFKVSDPIATPYSGLYKGKVVVIVNETSQSQAEYTTMAFQSSPNVTVIGSITAGADGNVSTILLPGGINTLISGLEILYPDGTETQRKGVKIDVQVKPTIAGIKAGRDELLEKAKEIIEK